MVTKNSTAEDPTSYTFYSTSLTLDVENFSVPSPQHVRGVKFVCEFYVIIQGEPITAETTTAVIPGFCKFIAHCKSCIIKPYLLIIDHCYSTDVDFSLNRSANDHYKFE